MRLTGWSSASSSRLPSRSASARLGFGRVVGSRPGTSAVVWSIAAGSPTGSVTVSRIVVPVPGALSIVTSPPINSASRLQMTSPRPVPPNRCAVDACACENSSNRRCCCSAGTPTPVSVTESSTRLLLAGLIQHAHRHLDPADLGELDRVREEVAQDLPQSQRVADVRRGEALVDARMSAAGRSPTPCGRTSRRRRPSAAAARTSSARAPAARPRSSRSPGCRR